MGTGANSRLETISQHQHRLTVRIQRPWHRTRLTWSISFFDLAWSDPNQEHPEGIIAGALENGSLDLYDAAKLLEGST